MFDLLQRLNRAVRESRGGGGSLEYAVALPGAHTPSKNPRSVSRMQAHIAFLIGGCVFEGLTLPYSENDPRNVCRNA